MHPMRRAIDVQSRAARKMKKKKKRVRERERERSRDLDVKFFKNTYREEGGETGGGFLRDSR